MASRNKAVPWSQQNKRLLIKAYWIPVLELVPGPLILLLYSVVKTCTTQTTHYLITPWWGGGLAQNQFQSSAWNRNSLFYSEGGWDKKAHQCSLYPIFWATNSEVLNPQAPTLPVPSLHILNLLKRSLIHTWNIFKSIPEVSYCGSCDDFIGPTID